MKVTFTGKSRDFTAKLESKIQEKLTKLGKMIEQRGEREAHVVHQVERHLHKIEIKVNDNISKQTIDPSAVFAVQ